MAQLVGDAVQSTHKWNLKRRGEVASFVQHISDTR